MNAVDKLYRRTADGIKPGLEVINTLLDELDTPHHKFVSIHGLVRMAKVLFVL